MNAPLAAGNPRIKQLRRLLGRRSARRADGLFVLEGPTLVREAIGAGAPVRAVLVDEALLPELPWLGPADHPVHAVQAGVLAKVLDTVTPRPIAALVELPHTLLDAVTSTRPAMVVVLAGVADPGNVGTLVRSAAGAGATGVVVCEPSADPFGPKAVRASAGSCLHLPVVEAPLPAALTALEAAGVGIVVADGDAPTSVDDVALDDVAIVLGNEAHGVPLDLGAVEVQPVAIPLSGGIESLNVAMAGTVLLFEAARRRRDSDLRGSDPGA